jgi:hypothetical protein
MKWLAPLLLSLTTPAVFGLGQGTTEVPEHLELKKALEIAIANNPGLKAARNDIEIAKADRLDATKRLAYWSWVPSRACFPYPSPCWATRSASSW